MPSWSRDILPLRVLVLRAIIVYPMLRALLFVVAALTEAFAGPGTASGLDNPVGVIALSGALGAFDVRRRGETLFWQNLGYPRWTAAGLFGLVALVGTVLMMLVFA